MSIPCEMLLHPGLLSNEQLVCVILERHLKIPNIESMDRQQLLELFHNFCVPYGQRKSRDVGRGKIKNNDSMETTELYHNHRKHSLHENETHKPPPDILSGHMKRIRINGHLDVRNENSYKEQFSNKRKIESQQNQAISTSGPSSAKKGRKPITWP